MTRNEVIDLLEQIDAIYPNRITNWDFGRTIEQWSKVLKDYDKDTVQENLIAHAEESPHPPSIADLVRKHNAGRSVPTYDETKQFLDRYDSKGEADPEVVRQAQENIRKILGMRGDNNDGTLQQGSRTGGTRGDTGRA